MSPWSIHLGTDTPIDAGNLDWRELQRVQLKDYSLRSAKPGAPTNVVHYEKRSDKAIHPGSYGMIPQVAEPLRGISSRN
ncbi:MAG: hypothetical protein ABIV50_13945 [Opitutus sp.]